VHGFNDDTRTYTGKVLSEIYSSREPAVHVVGNSYTSKHMYTNQIYHMHILIHTYTYALQYIHRVSVYI